MVASAFLQAGAPDAVALRDPDGGTVSYAALRDRVATCAAGLGVGPGELVLHRIANTVGDVVVLLACLEAGATVALLDPGKDGAALQELLARYRPDAVICGTPGAASPGPGYGHGRPVLDAIALWRADRPPAGTVDPLNALLLSTSGSTGSPKFVRLSRANLTANAHQIIDALAITPDDVACGHLALHYSYGLSVLLSHLAAGASVLVHGIGFMEAEFWRAARDAGCTSLPGVPFHYEMLRRLDLDRLDVPTLQVCTQAGGKMSRRLIEHFARTLAARGGRFHVMYGQTEASPRMTTLAAHDVLDHPDSVGPALKGAQIRIENDGRAAATGEPGEVVYSGPNVMLGYALDRRDLAQGDVTGGVLRTGDVGHLDGAGRLFITGRLARFAKVLGLRLSLDEIEAGLAGTVPVAALDLDGKLLVVAEGAGETWCEETRTALSERLNIHASFIRVVSRELLPRLASGKVDIAGLRREFT